MKLKKETLKQIIKEELDAVLGESRLLDRYVKDKDEEFKQYIRDMGKDPDEVIKALGPDSSNVMAQTVVDGYPKNLSDMPREIEYTWKPDSPNSPSGIIGFYQFVPETRETEFVTAYEVSNLEDELQRVRKQLSRVGQDAILTPIRN